MFDIQVGRPTGPYSIVRHPLYSAALLTCASMALLLGSWSGLATVTVLMVGLAIRTTLEERELRNGLPGYRDYTTRVRYRQVPYLW